MPKPDYGTYQGKKIVLRGQPPRPGIIRKYPHSTGRTHTTRFSELTEEQLSSIDAPTPALTALMRNDEDNNDAAAAAAPAPAPAPAAGPQAGVVGAAPSAHRAGKPDYGTYQGKKIVLGGQPPRLGIIRKYPHSTGRTHTTRFSELTEEQLSSIDAPTPALTALMRNDEDNNDAAAAAAPAPAPAPAAGPQAGVVGAAPSAHRAGKPDYGTYQGKKIVLGGQPPRLGIIRKYPHSTGRTHTTRFRELTEEQLSSILRADELRAHERRLLLARGARGMHYPGLPRLFEGPDGSSLPPVPGSGAGRADDEDDVQNADDGHLYGFAVNNFDGVADTESKENIDVDDSDDDSDVQNADDDSDVQNADVQNADVQNADVQNADDDDDDVYECEYDCGYEHNNKKAVEAHERTCPQKPQGLPVFEGWNLGLPPLTPDEELALARAKAETGGATDQNYFRQLRDIRGQGARTSTKPDESESASESESITDGSTTEAYDDEASATEGYASSDESESKQCRVCTLLNPKSRESCRLCDARLGYSTRARARAQGRQAAPDAGRQVHGRVRQHQAAPARAGAAGQAERRRGLGGQQGRAGQAPGAAGHGAPRVDQGELDEMTRDYNRTFAANEAHRERMHPRFSAQMEAANELEVAAERAKKQKSDADNRLYAMLETERLRRERLRRPLSPPLSPPLTLPPLTLPPLTLPPIPPPRPGPAGAFPGQPGRRLKLKRTAPLRPMSSLRRPPAQRRSSTALT